ncbi:MAG: N-acetyl-alpha-D-glucosaminyl L-malate synthase BshA [Flavobacteriales bacterium]|nr:N-acetyl-alpha-D-glucosaminyl L-malate synthase BshA [Flavobacteriales bacterium]MCX7768234.1 N-acetyl-alpha-D-glucosaminyl L-malate synthase BshA [Flavobacteriales bacterium]MDW8410128.1 N-acetyl-alpha-D-glucosaminyl L-malate synthase BshA [Flavobacteriales bacterium]
MRIGIILYPTFGGSGVVATELGLALARRGHEVHFISYRPPARLELLTAGVHYHEVHVPDYPLFDFSPYETALSSQIVEVILREHLNLLHAHYALPHATAAFLAREVVADKGIHLPLLTTLHGTDITLVGRDPSFAHTLHYVLKHSNGLSAVSRFLKDETERLFPDTRPIDVIPNFVNPDRYKPLPADECLKKSLSPAGEFVLAHISNFRPVKRVQDVVDIFYLVNKEVPARLLMVGDGPERPLAEERVRSYHIQDRVIFLGHQVHTHRVLPCSDFYLLPSNRESFGLSALEALASGVPVAGYYAGGLPEVVEHNVTGFLAEVGDVHTLAQNIVTTLRQPQRHQHMRLMAREAAQKFHEDLIIPRYESLYERLLKENLS